MGTVSLPNWNAQGMIPPFDAVNPLSVNRSPYHVDLADFVHRFAKTRQRRDILDGLLRYRAGLHAAGLVSGFQWVNGSFLEHVEVTESRPPNDVDVVTFFRLPPRMSQKDVQARNADLFDHSQIKTTYLVDGYLVCLSGEPEHLVAKSAYWYSVWSHRRNQAWKGYVQLDLVNADDAKANDLLKGAVDSGGSP